MHHRAQIFYTETLQKTSEICFLKIWLDLMFYMQNRCLTEIPPLCCFGFCATPFKNARRLPRVPLNLLIQTIQGKMDSNHGGWGGYFSQNILTTL